MKINYGDYEIEIRIKNDLDNLDSEDISVFVHDLSMMMMQAARSCKKQGLKRLSREAKDLSLCLYKSL